ncbi:MAG: aldose 1-epimerase [Flavobacteriales bacterium]|jgi:aldose 1-epimerase
MSVVIVSSAFSLEVGNSISAIQLHRGNAFAEILPEFGAMCNHLELCNDIDESKSIILGLHNSAELSDNSAYRGIVLFPFPNRLADGCCEFNGVKYRFPCNESESNNSLHGSVFEKSFDVDIIDEHSVVLTYKYDEADVSFPFKASLKIIYRLLSNAELTLEFVVVNNDITTLPLGLGWHPYYSFGGAINDLALELPKLTLIELDDRSLPTGNRSDYDVSRHRNGISTTSFDDCFYCEEKTPRYVVELLDKKNRLKLSIWQSRQGTNGGDFVPGFQYIQVCSDHARQSIAVEPMTCSVNAFNTREGLITLAPSMEYRVSCGVTLSAE